jgi:Mak10 subunit, NatC N(alpha)-terminal acetyltransferase
MSNFTEQEVLHDEPKLVDITFLIEKCASTLSFSQPLLCNEETFSLHDSMAALELMDSKMDCCELSAALVHPNNDPDIIIPPRSLPTSLDDKISQLPWNDLTIEDAAVIALESLSRLESLFRGASIAESTYTCLYAHSKVMSDMKERLWTEQFDSIQISFDKSPDESRAAQFVVYACTLAMLEIGDVVRGIVVNADIYEEEDFSVNTNGLEYSVGSGGPEAIKVIPEALHKLSYLNEDIPRYVPILCYILEFELAFLNACLSMSKLPSCPALDVTKDAQQQSRKGVEALEKLSTFLTTTYEIESGAQVLIKCFDPYIYRPLVGSAPVRKVVFNTPQISITTLKKVISEIDWAVCNLLISGSSLLQIRRILDYTSTSSVNILSRSLIVLNLYFDDKLLGKHFLGILISEEILQMMNIPLYLLESKYGKAFLHRLAKPMYDTLKLRLFNRNRQRAYMEAFMFHDWACLQQESQALDLGHRQELGEHILPYFTQYTLYMIVQLMDHHIALGIELGLFCSHHDLSVAYWYRDFVLSSLLSTITSIKNSKKASIDGKPCISHQDEFEDVEVMLIGFKRTLCRGIVRVSSLCKIWPHVSFFSLTPTLL